jgi:hypothetical protein
VGWWDLCTSQAKACFTFSALSQRWKRCATKSAIHAASRPTRRKSRRDGEACKPQALKRGGIFNDWAARALPQTRNF